MQNLPTGDVTFLFTDLEGSTRFWEHFPDVMPAVYERHDAILRQAVSDNAGVIFKVIGDAIQAAFPTPESGILAAAQAQRSLLAEAWPLNPVPRVRMALHRATISPDIAGDYRSPLLNRVGRLLSAAEGSQVLLSADLAAAIDHRKIPAISLLDLGEHRFRDLTPQRIYQVQAPGIPTDRARLAALVPHRDNLTPPATSLIGRDAEIVQVSELLHCESTQLVTLLGPGGVGKTRLARAVAAHVLVDFADGVWFVSLESYSDPADFPRAIAATVGIREGAEQLIREAIIEHFASRHTLLILDNFEQIADASPEVAALLRACPNLTVLATSRVPLNLSAETEYAVVPLPADEAAVDLFVDRFRAIQPSFRLTPESRTIIVEICRRLDGLPLAIELAAARGRMLPVDKLLSRLDERLPMLTGGPRDAPSRQRTLHATISWSFDLLSPVERACFAAMSIFSGGATVDALEPVLGGLRVPGEHGLDVFGSVENLARHSLLNLDASGRLSMLETIREYASALLRDSDDLALLEDAHANYFQQLVLSTQPQLILAEQAEAQQALSNELGNIRLSLNHFASHGPASSFVEMAAALWRFWSARGLLSEGRHWLDTAILQARAHNVDRILLAEALDGAGILAESQGDADTAQAFHAEALNLWRDANDATGMARSLENLGILALHARGDVVLSRELHAEALHLFETTKDTRGIESSLKSLGDVALFSEEFAEAAALYSRSLSIARQLHDTSGIAAGLTSLGALAFLEGNPRRAIGHYEEAVAFWRLLDDVPGIALCTGNLGEALAFSGRVDESVPLLKECLSLSRDNGDQQGVAFALSHLGLIARDKDVREAAQHFAEAAELSRSIGDFARLTESVEGLAGCLIDAGHADQAARLFGLAQSIRDQKGVTIMSVHKPALKEDIDRAIQALGHSKYAALFAIGATSDLDSLLPPDTLASISDSFG